MSGAAVEGAANKAQVAAAGDSLAGNFEALDDRHVVTILYQGIASTDDLIFFAFFYFVQYEKKCCALRIMCDSQSMNAIKNKLSLLPLDQVIEIAGLMSKNFSNEAEIILQAALDILEIKMPEADFISFCDKL